jgi:hypothetical protein
VEEELANLEILIIKLTLSSISEKKHQKKKKKKKKKK